METEGTILEQFEKSTEQENDVKQEQVEQVSQDVEEHAPEIVVHETSAESSYEEAEDKEPVEVKEEEETAEQVEEPKEEEVEEIKEEEPAESQEPKEEVEKSTKDSKEDDEDEEEDSKDSEKDKDDEEDDDKDDDKDKDKDDKSKKSESDMFEAIKSIIDSSMGQINERIAKLEDTVTKGLVTETVESEPVEQEVEPKVEAETIKEEEPVEEVTEAEPEAVIEAEEVEEPKEEEEPAEVEEEVTSKSVKVATQNRENNDEQAIKSVIQDDEDAVGYASKDASHIQETLEEEPKEEETAKSFDGVAQTVEAKENPQEFMIKHRQAFLDELSKAYKSSGYSNGYREDLRRAFLDINNGSHNKQQFELVKSFLNK